MRKISLTVSVGMLALLIGSCSSSPSAGEKSGAAGKTPATAQPTQPNHPTESPVSPSYAGVNERRKPSQLVSFSGLIPSTNPNRRRAAIVQGRQDPFTPILSQPIVKIKPEVNSENSAPVARLSPPKPPSIPSPSQRQGMVPPAKSPSRESLRKFPKLDVGLAQGVVVTGVVELGEITQIIVKAPNESFSRYVQPGQYLSDGRVLVKRIDMKGATPIVILEQSGIEVAKQIGEKAREQLSNRPEAPTALLPPPPPEI